MRLAGVTPAVVALALFAAAPAVAAPSFVGPVDTQSVLDSRSNDLTLTVGAAGVAAGDTVIVVGSKGLDQEAVAGVTDSRGNVYVIDRQLHGLPYSGMSMTVASGAIATALQPGDEITLHYEGTTGYTDRFGGAYEFSGLAPAPFDAAADAAGYGASLTSGAASSTQAGDLVFGLFELQAPFATFTAEAGANALPQIIGGAVNKILQPVWRVAGRPTAQTTGGSIDAFVSWNGIAVTYKSADPPPATPPANTAPPTIAGPARDGATLTADPGSWTGPGPITYAYAWQRCNDGSCTDAGTGAQYLLGTADVGSTMRVVVTAKGAEGTTSSPSATTAAVAPAPSQAAPGFVQTVDRESVTDDRSNTLVLTVPALGVAVGDTVVVVGCSGGAAFSPIASVVDSRGNRYAPDFVSRGGQAIGVFSAKVGNALPAGATITVTFEGTAAYTNRFAAAYEFSGLAAADHAATASSYGSQLDTSAAPIATDGALLFGVFNVASSVPAFTPGAGFVALPSTAGPAVNETLQPEWSVGGSAGPYSATGMLGGYASWTGIVVGYRRIGAPPPPASPVDVTPPGIVGTVQEGQRVNATVGTWTAGATATYGYQWQRCDASGACADISGATGTGYLVAHADVGSKLRVVVTVVDVGGATSAASAMVSVLPLPSKPVNTSLPSILGDPAHGSTLTAANGTWSGVPTTYTVQWRRCDTLGMHCVDVTQSSPGYPQTYQLVSTSYSAGATYRVAVTAANVAGSTTAVSAPTDAAFEPGVPGQPRFVRGVGSKRLAASTGSTISLTVPAGGVEAGDTVIVVAAKGTDAGAIGSISDSRGNTYATDLNAPAAAGSGLGVGIASGYVTTALQPGDTVDVTFAGPATYSGRWAVGYAFAGLAPAAADVSAVSGGFGTRLAVGPTTAISQNTELVFSAYGIQEAVYSDPARFTARGASLAGVWGPKTVQCGFEVVTSAAAVDAAATLSVDSSWAGALVTYRAG